MKHVVFALFIASAPAVAGCPDAPDITAELDLLIEEARAARNEIAGREISGRMWELWLRAPDAAAQEILNRGMRRRSGYDFLGAIDDLTALIDYCPNYAEGYNQRAFVYFLTDNFEEALVDLDRALALSADHVGAQSGRALTLLNLGRLVEARVQLLAALENNPWLSERFLLSDGGPLAQTGKDI